MTGLRWLDEACYSQSRGQSCMLLQHMSKRVLLLLAILLMTGAARGQACPANPPPPHGNIHSWTCGGEFHCPLGHPITFMLLGYNVQPCDEEIGRAHV